MGVTVAVARAAADTSAGTQDILTTDLGGLTPKAAIVIWTGATADDTPAAHAQGGIGFYDGTRYTAIGHWAEDAQARTDTKCADTIDTSTAVLVDPDLDGQATIAFKTNGCTLTWSNNFSSAYFITVIFFAGTDVSAYAGRFTGDNVLNGPTDITDPGFGADLVFLATDINNDGAANDIRASFGASDLLGAAERSISYSSEDNEADGNAHIRTDSAAAAHYAVEPNNQVTLSSHASGFTIDDQAYWTTGQDVQYLALDFDGAVSIKLGTYDTPTGSGNDAFTGPGFTPQAVILCQTLLTSMDALVDAGPEPAATWCISAFDDDDCYCSSWYDEDAAATTVCKSIASQKALALKDSDGSVGIDATFVSFDANGFTLNYTNYKASARYGWYVAIEEFYGSASASASASASPSATLSPSASASASPSASLSSSSSPSSSKSSSPSPSPAEMSVVWGRITGVSEDTHHTFDDFWTGTGSVWGWPGTNTENLHLHSGEYMISEVVASGASVDIVLDYNVYDSGDTIDLDYRHGATVALCEAASWNNYTVPFESSGFFQIRVTSTL